MCAACEEGFELNSERDGCHKCGDGIKQEDEECDDGNEIDFDSCTNECLDAACGDGIINFDDEECDDGNIDNNDGCDDGCDLECGNG